MPEHGSQMDFEETEERTRKVPSINVGLVVFGAIFLYIIISLFVFLAHRHVSYYQVVSGPLAKNDSYTGIAVRSETVITTDVAGYVTYFVRDENRVRRNGALFEVSPDQVVTPNGSVSAEAASGMREVIGDFTENYDSLDYSEVYSLSYDLSGELAVNASAHLSEEVLIQNFGRSSFQVEGGTVRTAPKDGIVVYTTDGYENFDPEKVTEEDFDTKGYTETDLRTDGPVEAGSPVLKMIDSENWSLVIPLTSLQVVKLDGVEEIKVKFLEDGAIETAGLQIISPEEGSYYAELTFDTGMVRYVGERFVDIELVTNTVTGLKIPVSSITTKDFYIVPEEFAVADDENPESVGFLKRVTDENGNETTEFIEPTLYENKDGYYYIDESEVSAGDVIVRDDSSGVTYTIGAVQPLEGVYCTNRGYAVFRHVVILDKNDEYCIVEEGTDYGISIYDYIVLKADEVKEEQITVR